MTERRVVRATLADLDMVRAVRIRALAEAPYAFASTLQREQGLGDDEWRSRMQTSAWFLAWRGACAVGIVAAFTEPDDDRLRHLVSMWVDPAERGTSLAGELVEAIASLAEEEGARGVVLWVADGNARARRFYERVGFTPTGRRQPLPSDPSVGESEMIRPLAQSGRSRGTTNASR